MDDPTNLREGLGRRDLLRGSGLALLALGGIGLPAGCGISGGGSSDAKAEQGTATADNPFGVPAEAPLDVVIFKGGFGDEYAKNAESRYQQRFPEAKVQHQGLQKIKETLQPRFNAGNPPDVIDSSGASALNVTTLLKDDQLSGLQPLLDAPSLDDKAKTVKDTLLPGVVEAGTLGDKFYVVNYAYTVNGFWYSKPLFEKNGWTYPQTWDAMLALCSEIKKSGIAPWTYQGKYPSYFLEPLLAMAGKAGGADVLKAIDNLEDGAWRVPAVTAAVEALHELVKGGFVLEGSEGLSHTESQTAFVEGKAAFIPCGSWLDNEMKGVTPGGFDMVVAPTPSVTPADMMPFTAIQASASEAFIVPSRAKNPAGGMEFLRIMLSKPAARRFSELTGSLSCVAGAADGLTVSTALSSARDAAAAIGDNSIVIRFPGWYAALYEGASTAMGELLAGRIQPAAFTERCQRAADKVAKDSTVAKYRR